MATLKKHCSIQYFIHAGLFLAVLLLFVLGLWAKDAQGQDWVQSLEILVQTQEGQERLKPWVNGDGTVFGFLPAYADPQQIGLRAAQALTLGEHSLSSSTQWLAVPTDEPIRLSNGTESLDMVFLKADQLPAIHIQTISGGMNRVFRKKTQTEQIDLAIYSPDGELTYSHPGFHDKIRGHGNSTWFYDKKAYNLRLSQEAGLLGMDIGKNWVLLANVADRSKIRNEIALQLAQNSMDCWTAHGTSVDVFINGTYQGVYFLTEKVEAEPNRIALSPGEVLFRMDLNERMSGQVIEELYPGLGAEVRAPVGLSEEQFEAASQEVQSIVQDVADGEMTDEDLHARLDLNAWAAKYMIEEITMNFDAGACSQYFSLENHQLKPQSAWDYDNSLGAFIHNDPASFLARRVWKDEYTAAPWYHDLWQYPQFQEAVRQIYRDTMLPLLTQLLDGELDQLYDHIHSSMVMEEARWPDTYAEESSLYNFLNLKEFLSERTAFLNTAWLDGVEYHMVCVQSGDFDYPHFTVPDGAPLSSVLGQFQETGLVDAETGAAVDFFQPVTHEMTLKAPKEPEEPQRQSLLLQWQTLLTWFCLGTLTLALALLVLTDKQNHSSSQTSAHKETAVH